MKSIAANPTSQLFQLAVEATPYAMELTNRQLVAIVESSDDAIISIDLNGFIQSWNQSAEKIFGYSALEMIGRPMTVLLPADRVDEVTKILARIQRDERVNHFETVRIRKDGQRINISATISPVQDEAGRVIGASKVARDITEQIRVQTHLEESRHELLDLAENSNVPMHWVDSNGVIIWANRAEINLLGYEKDEYIGRKIADFHADAAAIARILSQLGRGEELKDCEARLLAKDGSIKIVSIHSSVFLKDGKFAHTRCISSDITVRKRIEKALQQSESRKAAILDSALDCIITIDQEGRILDFNAASEQTFGYRKEQVLHQHLGDLIVPPSQRDADHLGIKHYLAIGQGPNLGKRIEITALRADGTEFPVELGISAVKTEGLPIFTAFLRDLTERKRAEKELQSAKEAADAANRAKSDFLANMSHEIRTPMNGVLGMTRLALDTELTPTQRNYLEMAYRSAESLLCIVNDILDFSKIEAGMLTLELTSFDLRECVENTVEDMALTADAKNLELTCEIDSDIPESLMGDTGRLRQVLLNLLSNAIKFTDQGEVALTVRKVSGANGEVGLQFSVRDTGIGIPPDKLGRIFEAFEQEDVSVTRTHGGTGLGLTISARLISLMGGTLEVKSLVGEGSTFFFRTQFRLSNPSVKRTVLRPVPEFRGIRVLIVDDNPTSRRILHDKLIDWDMRPHCVASGSEALRAIREAACEGGPFRIVLLDAMLPNADGFAVAETLRQSSSFDGTTIMMLSSFNQQASIGRFGSIGIQSYLTKPVKSTDLFNTIMEVLGKFNGAFDSAVVAGPQSVAAQPQRLRELVSEKSAALCRNGKLHILLAEDNMINQKVAIGTLQLAGHQIFVVNNGKEALAALEKQSFDLILMDLQMPEMDGFQATAIIRQQEKVTGRHTPIIALTAHAIKSDRERCLAAGMDSYLSKPIHPKEFLREIDNCVSLLAQDQYISNSPPPSDAKVFDEVELLERVGGNIDLFNEILSLCPGELTKMLDELDIAIAQRDLQRIQGTAHRLKGSLASLNAAQALEATQRLEVLGHNGELALVSEVFQILREHIERLKRAIVTVGNGAK